MVIITYGLMLLSMLAFQAVERLADRHQR